MSDRFSVFASAFRVCVDTYGAVRYLLGLLRLVVTMVFLQFVVSSAQAVDNLPLKTSPPCANFAQKLPDGSALIVKADGSITVNVPDDWFLFVQQNGTWVRRQSLDVTCTCELGQASVSSSAVKEKCATSSCLNCDKLASFSVIPVPKKYEGVGFVSQSEIELLPSAQAALSTIPEVAQAMLNFSSALGIKDNARTEKVVMVSVFGYVAALNLPGHARLPESDSAVGKLAAVFAAMNTVVKPAAEASCHCAPRGQCATVDRWMYTFCDGTELDAHQAK